MRVNQTFFVTGATGTLGQAFIRRVIASQVGTHILGISRDEQKQQISYQHPRVTYCLADIKDAGDLSFAAKQTKWPIARVFHFAALKCAPFLESNLSQALKTNVDGTGNVVAFAERLTVPVTMASTDKAVHPVTAYGLTKAMAERLVTRYRKGTVCRYGNVIGSRGSVLDIFAEQLEKTGKVSVTDLQMTRFWMPLSDAVEFVLSSIDPGLVLPRGIRSAPIATFVEATAKAIGVREYKIEVIGKRPGERLYELLTPDWCSDNGPRWAVNDLADAIRQTFAERLK